MSGGGGGTAPATLRAALVDTRRTLAAAGIATAALEARLFVARATGLSAPALLADGEAPMSPTALSRLAELVARRRAREPVAYILGEREFWSLPFAVDRSTLIPRPDSETLIEAALAHIRDARRSVRILDLGTGCGCLLLALLHAVPAASGLGVDLSEGAVRVARANADRLGLAGRAAFACGNWADAVTGRFDIVIANPPYIAADEWSALAPEVRLWEPHLALSGGIDGLVAYRELLPATARLLAADGAGFFEIGCGQAPRVATLARRTGFQHVDLKKDLAGIARCLQVRNEAAAALNKTLGNQPLPV